MKLTLMKLTKYSAVVLHCAAPVFVLGKLVCSSPTKTDEEKKLCDRLKGQQKGTETL